MLEYCYTTLERNIRWPETEKVFVEEHKVYYSGKDELQHENEVATIIEIGKL